MRWFIILIVMANVAHADFTATEAIEMEKLRTFHNHMLDATEHLSRAIDTGQFKAISAMKGLGQTMRHDCLQAVGWLLHVRVASPPFTAPKEILDGPREAVVAEAFAEADNCHADITVEINKINGNSDADSLAAITSMEAAQDELDDFDRTLDYATPLPVQPSAHPFPRMFGPHGYFPNSQNQVWAAQFYAWSAAVQAAQVNVNVERWYVALAMLNERLFDIWYVSNHLEDEAAMRGQVRKWTPSHAQLGLEEIRRLYQLGRAFRPGASPFCDSSCGTSDLYRQLEVELKIMLNTPGHNPVRVGGILDRLGQSWMALDRALGHWMLAITQ